MPPTRRPRPPRRRPNRRGLAVVEVLVAATVLTVGVLGAAGVLATAARDATRARARHTAVALLTARVERWRATPCSPAGASRGELRAGPLVERWRATDNGTLATLADTVTFEASSPRGAPPQRTGVLAVTWCAP